MEVWENEKCCGNTSRRRVFPKLFRVLPNFHECFYLTNRFHVAVRLFSNRSQMTSKCCKNKNVAYEAIAKFVTECVIALNCRCYLFFSQYPPASVFLSLYGSLTRHFFAMLSRKVETSTSLNENMLINDGQETLSVLWIPFLPVSHNPD